MGSRRFVLFSPHCGDVEWSAEGFGAFVDKEVIPARSYLRICADDADPFLNMDAIIRFENLEEDFYGVCENIGMRPLSLNRVNVGRHDEYRKYYVTDRMVEMVSEKLDDEIEKVGCKFEQEEPAVYACKQKRPNEFSFSLNTLS